MSLITILPQNLLLPDIAVKEAEGIARVVFYFDEILRGRDVGPSFVVRKDRMTEEAFKTGAEDIPHSDSELASFSRALSFYPSSTTYFGVERFHRMVAYTLARNSINAFEIVDDKDIAEIKRTTEDFGHIETKVADLAAEAAFYYLDFRDGVFSTALEYADYLVREREELPADSKNTVPIRIVEHWRKFYAEPLFD